MSFNLFNTRFLSQTIPFLPISEKKNPVAPLNSKERILNSLNPSEAMKVNFALASGLSHLLIPQHMVEITLADLC